MDARNQDAVTVELRGGRWEQTLIGEDCDALITDPPYSGRTEDGYRTGADLKTRGLGYAPINRRFVRRFVKSWTPRVHRWFVVFGDDITAGWWREAFEDAGLLTFAPVVWAKQGTAPRFAGDGPASACEYITVARQRGQWATNPEPWGSLPGWYCTMQLHPQDPERLGVGGQKPLHLMRALIRDYTRPGWRVIDPHAGSGTTLLAAALEGRNALGTELDPATAELARKRLEAPRERSLPFPNWGTL